MIFDGRMEKIGLLPPSQRRTTGFQSSIVNGSPSSIVNHQSSIPVSADKLAQEILLVHAVFESFFAVNKDHGDLVGELAAEEIVGVHINLLPGELRLAGELGERLFNYLAKVAALAGIEDDLVRHGQSLAKNKRAVSASARWVRMTHIF